MLIKRSFYVALLPWLLIFVFLSFPKELTAQVVPEGFCERLRSQVLLPIGPMTFNRQISLADVCEFESRLDNGTSVLITTASLASKQIAKKRFDEMLSLFMYDLDQLHRVSSRTKKKRIRGRWDEGFLLESVSGGANVVLVRKGKTYFDIISKDSRLLIKLAARIDLELLTGPY